MRYIGSKSTSLPAIVRAIQGTGLRARSLCDPFAGTCTVARHFKSIGWRVITGDVLSLSYALQLTYIETNRRPAFLRLLGQEGGMIGSGSAASDRVLAHLMALPPTQGFLAAHYSPAGRSGRRFFTIENAARADAVREQIAAWRTKELLTHREFAYLVSALLEAIDRVANTAGTYYAYLKRFSRKSLQPLRLSAPAVHDNGHRNESHLSDAQFVVGGAGATADILYLDPPYNRRNYSGYYHLPETVVRWDRPAVHGRSGMPRRAVKDSPFYHRPTAADALRELVRVTGARCILLHYATDGYISHRQILGVLRSRGPTEVTNWSVRKYSCCKSPGQVAECGHRLYTCLTR